MNNTAKVLRPGRQGHARQLNTDPCCPVIQRVTSEKVCIFLTATVATNLQDLLGHDMVRFVLQLNDLFAIE